MSVSGGQYRRSTTPLAASRIRPFVGRGEELAALDAAIREAVTGRGRALLIGGSPGIGKSRLLDQVERLGTEQGAEVHRARCWEEGGAPPFWPWVQIVRSIEGAASLPLGNPAGSGAGAMASAEGRFATFMAIAEVLTRAAKSRPRIVIVDDLHAADPASVVMLQFLASAIREARVLALAAYRDTEVAADASQAERFADLEREAAALHLRGLRENEVAQWFGERLGVEPNRQVLEALIERTEGNPLFVDGIFRSLEAAGGFRGGSAVDLRQIALPAEIASAVRGWVARLSERARPILQAASVIGIEFEVDLLVAVTDRAVEDALDALSEAAEVGVIAPDSRLARRRRFAHTMIQDALYRSIGSADRRRLDHRIARELGRRRAEDDEVAVTRIAHQLIRSVETETAAETLEYALEAAAAASRRHAEGDAANLLQDAVDIGRRFSLLDDERTAELLLELGRRRFQAGDRVAARAALRDAFELGRRVDRIDLFARAAIEFVGPTAPIGENQEARVLVERALEIPMHGHHATRAELFLALADTAHYEMDADPDFFSSAVASAKALADCSGDAELRMKVLVRELQGLVRSDDREYESALTNEAREHVAGISDVSLQTIVRSLLFRSFVERGLEREAEQQTQALRLLAESEARPFIDYVLGAHRMMRALNAGAFRETWQEISRTVGIGRYLDPMAERMLATQSFFTSLETEAPAARDAAIEKLIEQHHGMEQVPNSVYVPIIVRWRRGDRDEAFQVAARAGFPSLVADRTQGPVIVALLTDIASELGDACAARALEPWLSRWSDRAIVVSDLAFHCYGAIARHLGLARTVLERWDDAEDAFRRAISGDERIEAPLWANHARVDLASLLATRRAGDDEARARHLLSEVRPWAEAHDAKRLLRKIGTLEEALRSSPPHVIVDLQPATSSAESDPMLSLRRSGDFWTVSIDGCSVQLRDSKGLRYLDLLLRHPRREFHTAELIALVHGDAAGRSGDAGSRWEAGVSRRGLGSAGEVLDARAVSELRERVKELREELEEARSWNDAGRAERAREELEFLERELGAGTGLGGRIRRSADVDERMRKAVTNRIRDAIRRIAHELPDAGAALERSIRTGSICQYVAGGPVR